MFALIAAVVLLLALLGAWSLVNMVILAALFMCLHWAFPWSPWARG